MPVMPDSSAVELVRLDGPPPGNVWTCLGERNGYRFLRSGATGVIVASYRLGDGSEQWYLVCEPQEPTRCQ